MKHDALDASGLSPAHCRYGESRLFFRGPERVIAGRYVGFVGGSETFGRFVPEPFPALVEAAIGETCINLGAVNASIGAFAGDADVIGICRGATLNVVQVTGAQNLSNRFYTVHPRRNDRFIRASSVLQAIFPEVDFSEICFTRHLLRTLRAVSLDRFEIVRQELARHWSERMREFLDAIGPNALLLWFAPHLPSDAPWCHRPDPFRGDPLFVTRKMIDELRPRVSGVIVVQPSQRALAQGTDGLLHLPHEAAAAAEMLNPAAHREAAEALAEAIRARLPAEARIA